MHRLKITLRVIAFTVFGLFLHYVLPQHDVVKITSTEIIRTDFSGFNRIFYAQADSGAVEQPTRDLRLINTDKKKTFLLGFMPRDKTEVMVYRNEDTGWIWPPYFKFDSSDLQAESASVARGDSWAVITHYGWRVRWASIYPNAIAVKLLDSPDVRVIPWFNIFLFGFLIVGIAFLRAMWMQFRERSIDPLIDSAEDRFDEASADIAEQKGRVTRWLGTWKKKS